MYYLDERLCTSKWIKHFINIKSVLVVNCVLLSRDAQYWNLGQYFTIQLADYQNFCSMAEIINFLPNYNITISLQLYGA